MKTACEWHWVRNDDGVVGAICVREAKVRQLVESLHSPLRKHRNLCKFHSHALAARSGEPTPITHT